MGGTARTGERCWSAAPGASSAAVSPPCETGTGRPPGAMGTREPNSINKRKDGAGAGAGSGQSPLVERWMNGTLLSSTTGERGLFCIRGTRCRSCCAWRWASRSSFRHCTSSGSLCGGQGMGHTQGLPQDCSIWAPWRAEHAGQQQAGGGECPAGWQGLVSTRRWAGDGECRAGWLLAPGDG